MRAAALNEAGVEAVLVEALYKFVAMQPGEAATWIHDHLDEIEARFAS
jgi:hypothetical protein